MVAVPPPPPAGSIVYDRLTVDGQHTFVYRERADGSGRFLVLRDAYDPVWSPDGRFVAAFAGPGIVIATPAGRVARRIHAAGSTAYLTWSPDGRWFAYIAQHCDDGRTDPACGTLWLVRADGTERRRASREDGVWLVYSYERPYAWSPDSRRIVYTGVHGLVFADVVTGRRHELGRTGHIEAIPQWSPDGRRLLYTYGEQLVTAAADGRGRRLVRGAHDALAAVWSPDGARIAYIQDIRRERFGLYVVRPDGSQRVRVAPDVSDQPFRWSPDGRYLLIGKPGADRFLLVPAVPGRVRDVPGGDHGDWGR